MRLPLLDRLPKLPKFPSYRDALSYLTKTGLSNREIAIGVAVGNFVGILPLVGLHTACGVLAAHVFRLNQIVVFAGEQISNPISFPFILILSAQLGSIILSGGLMELRWEGVNVIRYYLLPTLLGSLIIAVAVSAVSYFLLSHILKRTRPGR